MSLLPRSIPTTKNRKYATILAAAIVAPTGVSKRIAANSPKIAQIIAVMQEHIITERKLLNTCIAERGGNIIKAETRRAPTKFIAMTITTAVMTAMIKLYASVCIQVAFAKFSSNVTEKILL